jgi:hypothetical protein
MVLNLYEQLQFYGYVQFHLLIDEKDDKLTLILIFDYFGYN